MRPGFQFAITILNWKYWEQTIECLKHILLTYPQNVLFIIIENGSANGSNEKLHGFYNEQFELISSEGAKSIYQLPNGNRLIHLVMDQNLGYAGGMNQGAIVSNKQDVPFCLILNNDAYIEYNEIYRLMKVSVENKNALVGPVVYDYKDKEQISSCGRMWPVLLFGSPRNKLVDTNKSWKTGYIEGSVLLLSNEFIKKRLATDGYVFDPKYFLYYEDVDLCRRSFQLGYDCLIDPNTKAYHIGSLSSGGAGNNRSRYYMTRNRVLIVNRYLPFGLNILFHIYFISSRLIISIPRFFNHRGRQINKVVFKALKDAYSGKFGQCEVEFN